MAEQKKYITINVSVDSLKNTLKKLLTKSAHSNLIADVIINSLEHSEVGLEHLHNAFSGIEPHTVLKIGDDVLVSFSDLHTWRMNKTNMIAAGLIKKGNMVQAEVLDIDLYKSASIQISYTKLDDAGTTDKDTMWINSTQLTVVTEEFPEDHG